MTSQSDRTDLPAPAVEPTGPAFSGTLKGPRFLRVGIVLGATLVLLVSAALTFGASPAPSGAAPNGAATPDQPGVPPLGGFGFLDPDGGPGGSGPRDGDLGFGRHGGKGQDGRGIGRQITVAAIAGSNLSLKTDDGWSRTIAVTSATKLTKAGQAITLGDIKVGDAVRFSQTRNADGSFTIDAVAVVVPRIAGEVTAVSGSGFTVKARNGTTWTVRVNGSTTYTVGARAGTKADVTVGSTVAVSGTRDSDSTMTAMAVRVRLPTLIGRVTAKGADTITIEHLGGGTVTIHVSGSTTYRVPGDTSPSLSDITVGSLIGAAGTQRADGSLDASVVQTAPDRFGRRFRGDGTVPNPNGKAPSGSQDPSAAPASVG